MIDGPAVFAGRVVELHVGPDGREGRISVRGARMRVMLDLVPEAVAGDTVLVHAGVALSLLRGADEGVEWGERED
jgi:hydrogenase maturation factor